MHAHAKISAWQREHDGSYKAELDGFTLTVSWHPEPPATTAPDAPEARRGFSWKVETPDGRALESDELSEEIELAMAAAERAARLSVNPEAPGAG